MDDRPEAMEALSMNGQRSRPARRRRGLVILALGLAALVALAWLLTHRDAAAAGTHDHRPTPTVTVAVARPGDIPVRIEALGTVTPLALVTVQPQVSGVITQMLYREGQMVTKGDTLAIIDQRPFEFALQQAQAALERDAAQLQVANLTLSRYRTLLTQDSVATQDVDTQAATAKQLAGEVAGDRAAVGVARLNLGYSRITAPVSGRAGLRAADVGAYVTPTTTGGIATIAQMTPIDVEFAVPQGDVPRIQARAAVAAPPVAALDASRSTLLAQGSFLTLDNAVDPTTGTVKVKARFPNADARLFPDQFVNVDILLDTLKGVVTVPAAAVRTGPNGDFVYVVTPARKVVQRPVVRGPADGDTVAIVRGLARNETVVIAGGDQLTSGMTVQIAGARSASSGSHPNRRTQP